MSVLRQNVFIVKPSFSQQRNVCPNPERAGGKDLRREKKSGGNPVAPAPQGEAPIAIGVRPGRGGQRLGEPGPGTTDGMWRRSPRQKSHRILPPWGSEG